MGLRILPLILRTLGDMTSSRLILNMTTGPVEVSERVLDAQRAIVTSPHVGDFWGMHDETLARLGRVVETEGTVLAFPGSIRAGLSVALGNLVRSGTRVLAISNGYWGELIADMCRELDGEVSSLALPPLLPVDPDEVRRKLKECGPTDLVTIVHVETNVGVTNPIAEIGAIVREVGALFLVDTACSAGAMPIGTDRNSVDIGVTGSHKCLAGLPGLAVVTVSSKAWDHLAKLERLPGHFDLFTLKRQTIDRPEPPAFTQPTGLFAGLHEALGELERHGLPNWYERHRQSGRAFRDRIRSIGMSMVPDLATPGGTRQSEAVYSDTVLAVSYGDSLDDEQFRARLGEDHGVFVIGNLGDWKGRSFRVGLMSPPQLDPINMERTLDGIQFTAARLRSN